MNTIAILTVFAIAASAAAQAQPFVNAQLPWHPAVTDAQGKLLAWHEPEKNLGYDKVLRLGWDFIKHDVPADTRHGTGLKIYLIGPVFHAGTLQNTNWQLNAAMRTVLGGDIRVRTEPCERILPGPSGKVRAVVSLWRE